MKILAMGDFHGRFPDKLFNIAKRKDIDFILSPGDYCGDAELSKLFFKYVYGKNESEIPEQVKQRLEVLEKRSFNSGLKVVKRLKELNKKIYGVRGNWDPLPWEFDLGAERDKKHGSRLSMFNSYFKNNLELIDFKLRRLEGLEIVGGTSTTHPGKLTQSRIKNIEKSGEDGNAYIRKFKEQFARRKKDYIHAFDQARGRVIFLTHNCPYRTQLDKIGRGIQKGKHYGSFLEKQLILKYKPFLVICGHMHENQGKQKIGNTWIVNTGAAGEGKAAIVEIENKEIKNIKFIR